MWDQNEMNDEFYEYFDGLVQAFAVIQEEIADEGSTKKEILVIQGE